MMSPPQAISILIFFFFFFFFLNDVSAQSLPLPSYMTNDFFKPSLAIIVGVLSIVFTLTLALLIYAKLFNNDIEREIDRYGDRGGDRPPWQGIFNPSSRFSGLNKTAIESLPFFRFSALKGSKQGLECSVCLSKFEDAEILRLLPKCRHAFHIGCIDQWLEKHTSCPLCRNRVSAEDELSLSVLGQSNNSLRIGSQLSVTREEEDEGDSSLELYIEREEDLGSDGLSSRFSSFRKILKIGGGKKDKTLSFDEQGNELFHKFNHRIVVSEAVFKNRWSNVTSSDLTFLTSEMLNSFSVDRFSTLNQVARGDLRDKEDLNNKDSSRRTLSEIVAVPRENAFAGSYNSSAGPTVSTSRNSAVDMTMEDKRRRLWLPIARRTAQWFVSRDKSNQVTETRQNLNV